MVCLSWCSPLCPLFHFLGSIIFIYMKQQWKCHKKVPGHNFLTFRQLSMTKSNGISEKIFLDIDRPLTSVASCPRRPAIFWVTSHRILSFCAIPLLLFLPILAFAPQFPSMKQWGHSSGFSFFPPGLVPPWNIVHFLFWARVAGFMLENQEDSDTVSRCRTNFDSTNILCT